MGLPNPISVARRFARLGTETMEQAAVIIRILKKHSEVVKIEVHPARSRSFRRITFWGTDGIPLLDRILKKQGFQADTLTPLQGHWTTDTVEVVLRTKPWEGVIKRRPLRRPHIDATQYEISVKSLGARRYGTTPSSLLNDAWREAGLASFNPNKTYSSGRFDQEEQEARFLIDRAFVGIDVAYQTETDAWDGPDDSNLPDRALMRLVEEIKRVLITIADDLISNYGHTDKDDRSGLKAFSIPVPGPLITDRKIKWDRRRREKVRTVADVGRELKTQLKAI